MHPRLLLTVAHLISVGFNANVYAQSDTDSDSGSAGSGSGSGSVGGSGSGTVATTVPVTSQTNIYTLSPAPPVPDIPSASDSVPIPTITVDNAPSINVSVPTIYECSTIGNTSANFKLTSTVHVTFLTVNGYGFQQCEMKCKRWHKCQSINYDKVHASCHLNLVDSTHNLTLLSINENWIYSPREQFENVSTFLELPLFHCGVS